MSDVWQPIATAPEGEVVMTKIDDATGARNKQSLVRRGAMFFVPDGSMYVYYRPTHWRPLSSEEARFERAKLADKAERLVSEARRVRAIAARLELQQAAR